MVTEFKFPDVGEGITEGEIVKWHVRVGDVVKEHDIIADVETDKAVAQIPSPVAGTILKLACKEGETIQVGAIIAVIGDKSETRAEAKKDRGTVMGELPEAEDEPLPVRHVYSPAKEEKEILASPAARKLAKDSGIDLSSLKGTGPSGRITEEDVKNASGKSVQSKESVQAQEEESEHAEEPLVERKYDFFGYVEHVPFKGIRKTTAKNMVRSLYTATHVTHMDEADVTDLFFIREKEKADMRKKGIHLTFMPFVIKALVKALKEYPYLNATLDEEKNQIVLKKYYNIGVAVDIEGGLLVPVVKNAQLKSIADLAREIQDLAQKARERKLDVMDMKGGTFTVTNVGSIGGIFATPVINFPEVAILALGKIMDKPMVIDGKITARKIMPMSLAFDHRVLDGAEAARFTTRLIQLLEDPDGLMIE
jgi:pyruvate dehydrogenase E2 component (dihydrolipoamide acetyltransferase)